MIKVAFSLFTLSGLFFLTNCGGGGSVHNRPGRGTYCKTTTEKVLVSNKNASEKLLKFKPGQVDQNKQLAQIAGEYEYSSMTFEYRMPTNDKKKIFIYHKSHSDGPYKNQKVKSTQLQALEDGHIEVSPTRVACIYGFNATLKVPEVTIPFVKNITLSVDNVENPTKWTYTASKLFESKIEENLATPRTRGVSFIDESNITSDFTSWQDLVAKFVENPKDLKPGTKFYEISTGVYNLNYQLLLDNGLTVTVNIAYKKK